MSDLQCIHTAPGPAGHCGYCGAQLVHNRPSRLAAAKAALEEARAECNRSSIPYERAVKAHAEAIAELAAAEAAAAARAIPPALLEVAREAWRLPAMRLDHATVADFLARSHGIDPAALRLALEAK